MQAENYYDVVKWREPDCTRRILPFRELHIRNELCITTILLELAVESFVFLPIKFMLPKRRFWKAEQTFQYAFSKHFSTFCRPNPHILEKCFEKAY